jgi:hypothetical protein
MKIWIGCRLLFAGSALIVALGSVASHGATYYVSSSHGSDSNSGLSAQTPWKTLGRVNQPGLMPGTSVLLRRGDVWHEELRPRTSGSSSLPIRYSAYGSGKKPVISGSDEIAPVQWSHTETGVYCLEGVTHQPTALWRRGARLRQSRSESDGWWYEPTLRRACLRSAHSPEGVEVQIRGASIDNNGQSHITYDGLDLEHALEGLRIFLWSGTARGVTIENCLIVSEPSVADAPASAGVYVSARAGTVSQIAIRNNEFHPFPRGLNHWGVYFVQGIDGFAIEDNRFGPAGEDAITVWHSAHGVISGNHGGGNGENTIDVKDSQAVIIRDNDTENDREYNIVVHSVDEPDGTRDIAVSGNRCRLGGSGGNLSAGIALLGVRRSTVRDNWITRAYGTGILVLERTRFSGNQVDRNHFDRTGIGQHLPSVVWQYPASGRLQP